MLEWYMQLCAGVVGTMEGVRLLYHSTLGSRVTKKRESDLVAGQLAPRMAAIKPVTSTDLKTPHVDRPR